MTFDEWLGDKHLGSMELEFSKDAFVAGAASRDAEVAKAFEAGRRAEREECAQILERQDVDPSFKHRMASAIRARGDTK